MKNPSETGSSSSGGSGSSSSSSGTVVVAEDSILLRNGLVGVLHRFGFDVVAEAGDVDELLQAVDTHEPDVVLTDVRMPPGFRDEGLRAAVELRRRRPELPVLVLSQYVEHRYAARLIADGGSGVGYLLKDRVTEVGILVGALRDVLAGGTVVDPEVVRRLLLRRRDPLTRLSERERETLALMAQGLSNAAIGEALVISDGTVAKYIRSVFDKLELPPDAAAHRRVLAVITYLRQHDD